MFRTLFVHLVLILLLLRPCYAESTLVKNDKDFTISRWKNECFIKIIHPKTTSKIEQKRYKIDKGYEWEIILKEKPVTNIFSYQIESKGLDFFYQPPLTQAKIDDGAFRPDNVIGSYTIEHKTKMNNEYKSGKFGHIYRPKIIDANNNWIWAEFNKDLNKSGILTITIPQSFLDTAVYPVIVDPTFGDTGGRSSTQVIENAIHGSHFTMGATAGTVDTVHCETAGGHAAFPREARGVIYVHGAAPITPIIGTGEEFTINDNVMTYRDSTMSSESLSASTEYWLMCWGEDGSVLNTSLSYDLTGPASKGAYDGTMTYHATNDPDDPLTALGDSRTYGIYCTYTETGGGAAPIVPIVNIF